MVETIRLKRRDSNSTLPKMAHEGDACFDLYSSHDAYLGAGSTKIIDTGFDVALPSGYVGFVCSRSGLASKSGVFVLNAPGVVDSGYRGPLKVILHNSSNRPHTITAGDRVGQLMLQKVLPCVIEEVEEFNDDTTRGTKGFGSTGR